MREWAWACALAYMLDLCLGDPAWLPHPVAAIGRLITLLERWLYPLPHRRWTGIALLLVTAGITMGVVALLVLAAARLGAPVRFGAEVALMWMALATRSLLEHGESVREALRAGDMPAARARLTRMVSRETGGLEAGGIARACIESLAENLTDGCLSPLLFGLVGGPVAAWGLKAVSTLDSMVGYRNARYAEFGWASAKCDDALHYIPARLLWLLLPVASWCVGASGGGCWRTMWRDRRKSESPNSGLPEAGVAGALGIELGGPAVYDGVWEDGDRLNAAARSPEMGDIRRAQWLVLVASALPAVLAAAAAVGIGV